MKTKITVHSDGGRTYFDTPEAAAKFMVRRKGADAGDVEISARRSLFEATWLEVDRLLAQRPSDAEVALTQVQHIAYEALVRVEGELDVPAGRLTAKELRQLARYGKETLNRINSIAEGGKADPEFVAMLAAAEEIIPGVTVSDVEAASMGKSDGMGR